jgi:hypothetical protein
MEPAGIGLSLVQRKKVQFDDGVGSGVRLVRLRVVGTLRLIGSNPNNAFSAAASSIQ